MRTLITLRQNYYTFAHELAQLQEWTGPKDLGNFERGDWKRFVQYLRRDDESLSENDRVFCGMIADEIETRLPEGCE